MRFTMISRAVNDERYAPGCFDSQIGMEVPLTVAGRPVALATVVAAEVSDDGRSVQMTYDVPDDTVFSLTVDDVRRAGLRTRA